jgi:AcrR family transcriptional regulator
MSERPDGARSRRGKPVRDAILAAALHDISTHGVDGLNIERVATIAGVNKTTVYRRYPSPEQLAAAALHHAMESTATQVLVDRGSLREDLDGMVANMAEVVSGPAGQALVRAGMSAAVASADATIPGVGREPKELQQAVERAVARGEWDPNRSPEPVFAMLVGAIIHRTMLERRPVTDRWRRDLVDVVVRGLAPRDASAPSRPRQERRHPSA